MFNVLINIVEKNITSYFNYSIRIELPVSKSACSSFNIERAISTIFLGAYILWGLRIVPSSSHIFRLCFFFKNNTIIIKQNKVYKCILMSTFT